MYSLSQEPTYRKALYDAESDTVPLVDSVEKDDKAKYGNDWEDLMNKAGQSFGGDDPYANNGYRPAFGSSNTVQSGGFGKYRSAIMSFL